MRSPLQAPASAGNDEARRQQMIRERAVEVRLRARVPRTRLARASHAPRTRPRTAWRARARSGAKLPVTEVHTVARDTRSAPSALRLCAQLLRFKATATETDAQHETRGSVRAEQADSEAFVVEQAIRLIEGGPEENVLDR